MEPREITSFTYRPHSNECGPRTLLALAVTVCHPDPSASILLPYMDENIAQMSRWRIASSILQERIDLLIDLPQTSIALNHAPTWRRKANLSDLADLSGIDQSLPIINPPIPFPSNVHNLLDDMQPSYNSHSDSSSNPISPHYEYHATNTTLQQHNLSLGMSPVNDSTSGPISVVQPKITQWTTHQPFIPGVTNLSLATSIQLTHPHQVFMNHLQPFGTPMPIIDQTKILHVCVQNPQHSFRL
jgi:hypothetical protein